VALDIARQFVRRSPLLREAWPVRQAREWRIRQSWREHPRRMASWYRDAADMRTRVFVSNLELPEAAQLCQPVSAVVRLFDSDGNALVARRHSLARNASLALELRELLPPRLRGHVQSGMVQVDFEGPHLGSSRAYLHWYNERCLTSSHEKFGLTIPAVGGYWTVPNVQDSEEYRVHLAVTNLDARPYTSMILLKDADGRSLEASVDVPPNGSRFLALDRLFEDVRGFLGERPGVIYFGNNRQPAMYYYFVANQRLGTWRAQHL
jgi:hypothetical protein